MKLIQTILAISLLMLLAACGAKVHTVNPSTNDLSDYHTFAYLPNTNADVQGKNYLDTMVNRSIVETVRLNLMQNGMELDRKNPDLLVLISTSTPVERSTQTEPVYATYPYTYGVTSVNPYYNPYYYYDYGTYTRVVGYNTTTYSYEEGTVIIDLIDRETKNTVWKGIAKDRIYDQPTNTAVRAMVNDIFDEFPAQDGEK